MITRNDPRLFAEFFPWAKFHNFLCYSSYVSVYFQDVSCIQTQGLYFIFVRTIITKTMKQTIKQKLWSKKLFGSCSFNPYYRRDRTDLFKLFIIVVNFESMAFLDIVTLLNWRSKLFRCILMHLNAEWKFDI